MKTSALVFEEKMKVSTKKEIIWGFAGPWYGEYNCWDGDLTVKKLNFIIAHGFKSMGIGLNEMEDASRRDLIASIVDENDLQLTTGIHLNMRAADDEIAKKIDQFLYLLDRHGEALRVPIVTTGAGFGHRFERNPGLQEKLERMSRIFAPLAKALYEMGRPLGIENHGDFYCSDLVQLCRMTPHMNIFLDTGNTFLVGERCVPACRGAAPYVIGTHLKDHYVYPDAKNLTFVLKGAALGEGDAGLDQVIPDLYQRAKANKLVLHWELIKPEQGNPLEAIDRSWNFIKSLS